MSEREEEAGGNGVALMPQTTGALVPGASRLEILRQALAEDRAQRQLVAEYVRTQMIVGVDFGIIPGTKKPSLWKPGAEKLVSLFRVLPEYQCTDRVQDWDRGIFSYEYRCELRTREDLVVLAVGVGSANTMEARYRWRDGQPTCPRCGQPTICRGREDKGGGWYCWKKKGGCGSRFAIDDQAIVAQPVGRIENDDRYSLVNTVLKMSKKRSLVDGAIALAHCSDMFTQDREDQIPVEEADEDRGGPPPWMDDAPPHGEPAKDPTADLVAACKTADDKRLAELHPKIKALAGENKEHPARKAYNARWRELHPAPASNGKEKTP